MAHGTKVNAAEGVGQQELLTVDPAQVSWPTAGNVPTSLIYQGAAPGSLSPVNEANPLWVRLPNGTTVQISGTVTVAGTVVTGALTDAQLRASAVPVSGPLTDVQLRASPVPVSGTFYQATQPISAVSLPLPTGAATEATLSTVETTTQNVVTQTTQTATNLGISTDVEASGNGTLIAILKRCRTFLQGIQDRLPTALTGGGNLKVSLQESAVAQAVNPISGQTGVAAGAGAVNGLTQRVTHASDDPVVTALQLIDNMIAGNEAQVDVVTLPTLPAGDNNIGNVDVLTLPTLPAGTNNIGDVDVVTQPARSAAVDAVTAAFRTGVLMSGLTQMTVKFAPINESSSGDRTIVAAVASKKIKVIKYRIIPNSDVVVTWKTNATGITGPMSLAGKAGDSGAEAMLGHFETIAGEPLKLNLATAVQVSGYVVYVEE